MVASQGAVKPRNKEANISNSRHDQIIEKNVPNHLLRAWQILSPPAGVRGEENTPPELPYWETWNLRKEMGLNKKGVSSTTGDRDKILEKQDDMKNETKNEKQGEEERWVRPL